MKRLIFTNILIFILLTIQNFALAQRPVSYDSPAYEYEMAVELFQKAQYGAAQEYFQFVYNHSTEEAYDWKTNAYYYLGVCAAKLNNGNADFLLNDFIRKYPIHSNVSGAHFHLARYYFFKKDYKSSLNHFNEIDERSIATNELAEYYFKKGYANLVKGEIDDAKYLFRQARQYEGYYQLKSIYYTAYIAYESEQYIAALEDFKLLENEKDYVSTVPFFIAQIHFIEKEYDTVVATAPALVEKASAEMKSDFYRIIALSYYHLRSYEQAETYFDQYFTSEEKQRTASPKNALSRNDYYAVGFTKYRLQKYREAIDYLALTTKENDALAQNAYYLIGDCQLKNGESRLAARSFLAASKSDFTPVIQEDAFFNYAKLQYETSTGTYDNALAALEEYINRYPHSARSEEATSYLAKIYASTKNYKEAIKSIEKIGTKSTELRRSYQRCTHFYALQLYNNKQYKEASAMLDKSMMMLYQVDPTIQLSNLYWKGEAAYRTENYREAYNTFKTYYKSEKVSQDANYPISFYAFGYAAMKYAAESDRPHLYKEAQESFDKYLSFKDIEDNYRADACARLGDSYFMQRKLQNAVSYYEKCEKLKSLNADYALYQQSKCYGYLNQSNKRVQLLEKFTQLYTQSSYIDEVEYELANTYHAQNQYALAINAYNSFVKKYPKSAYVREAHNKLAQAYLNSQDTEKSIATFKKVIELYPGSQEAKDALANLESIYTDLGTTGEFFDYIKSKGNISISPERQDSITYKAAESKYTKGNCELATTGFNEYISKFPEGYFTANAYFYRAECAYGRNSFDEALADYEHLIENYRTAYNETALRKAASILFNKNEFDRALAYFNDLLACSTNENNSSYAYNGIMRCAFALQNYHDALNGAKGYLTSPNADPEYKDDATLIAGEASFHLRDYSGAQKYLTPLSEKSTNDIAAEAAYYCALAEFTQGNLDACETTIGKILEANYTSSYWLASTFILYGDFYLAKGNLFQARHTYQSIVDNYDGEDLRIIAQEKINKINEIENPTPIEDNNKGFDNNNHGNDGNSLRPVDE